MQPGTLESLVCCAAVTAAVAAGCGAAGHAPIDVAAVVRTRGVEAAHRELALRVRSDPRNVQFRLALAELAERLGRPGEAIEELIAVERAGGPFGTRWRDVDRARLARLLLVRGRIRLQRRSSRALDDLMRARALGAGVASTEIAAARAASATAALRHVDADQRAKARAEFASLAAGSHASARDPSWIGARVGASLTDRAAFGVWAWNHGALREGYEQLAAWRNAAPPPRDARFEAVFQCANAWWTPPSAPRLATDGATCAVAEARPPAPAGTTVVSVDPSAGYGGDDAGADAAAQFARARAVAIGGGAPAANDLYYSDETTPAAGGVTRSDLIAIARAYRRAPAAATRLAADAIARSVDAAMARATLGALFSALGDPARARAEWAAATAASNEVAIAIGYAEACARAGDGDAALVAAMTAAAAAGDPAEVWNTVGQALLDGNRSVDALVAARSAIDLAGPQTIATAFAVAIDASRRLGRSTQAEALAAQRDRVVRRPVTDDAAIDRAAASADLARDPSEAHAERAWLATRREPREIDLRIALLAALAGDDPRRGVIVAELVELAGDRDTARGLRAAGALR